MRRSLCVGVYALIFGSIFLSGMVRAEDLTDRDDLLLSAFRLDALAANLKRFPEGAERNYLEGMAANLEGRNSDSVALLTSALPKLRTTRPDRAAKALLALSDDYTKQFQYGQAANTDEDLLNNFKNQLTPEQAQNARNDFELYGVLRGAPPQSLKISGAVVLHTTRNPLGSVDANLTANGIVGNWLLDTGANMSVVAESYAKQLGLKLLPGVAHTQASLTGIENAIHVALIPTLQMGGAVLQNVVVLVLPDDNLNVQFDREGHRYQINAIIGYPVFQELGRVTFTRNGEFLAGDDALSSDRGAKMYMKALNPVIECTVERQTLPFAFDTGASRTQLLIAYYNRFKDEVPKWQLIDSTSAGAGGAVRSKVYLQKELEIGVGDRTATLKNITIAMTAAGVDTEGLYGNLGQDLVADYDSFTLDFNHMRFSLGKPLSTVSGGP